MLGKYLDNLRERGALVHNITNYVTVTDCANILIACGGAPIMADEPKEAEDITSICGGLNINIGTLNERTIKSMHLAGRKANELNHPVLLDPVGAGASALRTDTARQLMDELKLSVIRGNISEIKALSGASSAAKGVDADESDAVTTDNLDSVISFAKSLAKKTGAIVAITGETDIVADSERGFVISNGCAMMAQITGSGCMLSAMTTAFVTATPANILEAAAASVCAMGICGEKAFETTTKNREGNSSFRNHLIDEIFLLDGKALDNGAKYEIR